MSDDRKPEILGGLPHRRTRRRSEKRTASSAPNGRTAGTNGRTAGAAKRSAGTARRAPATSPKRTDAGARARSERLRQPKQPGGTPAKPASRRPAPPSGPEVVSTVVQAAAELVEIGLSASARAVRNTLARLPRP